MKIGFFTDTYFPQVSGVATSIYTLKEEMEKHGHEVYIFTTTDPNATDYEEGIIRMPSVPFISFKDRRIVVRGMWYAYLIAKELELDLIHTHTEFGTGFLGKLVGKKLKIPVIHTYHTMYEDYLHYIAKGKVVRPTHVKHFSKFFTNHSTGVVCPSQRVINKLQEYGVTIPMRIIPTGIDIAKFRRPDITVEMTNQLRQELGISLEEVVLLSLSRISYEKNIQAIISGLPAIIEKIPHVRLVIVGKGPYEEELKQQVSELGVEDFVLFIGEIPNQDVSLYYKTADYFVCASTSETQGLTYTEAMAAGVPCVVEGNDYLNTLIDDIALGCTFEKDQDFAEALVEYVHLNLPKNPTVFENKLFEISAENFGDKMLAFYYEMMEEFAENQNGKTQKEEKNHRKVKLISLKHKE